MSIVIDDPRLERLAQELAAAEGTTVESVVRESLLGKLDRFLEEIEVIVVPFDEPRARIAVDAFQRYGKSQGHPAQLNMGDCAVYALAKTATEPLLFVGNDFSQTDVEPC